MPAERDATTSIGKSFAPPPPIIAHPDVAEPAPGNTAPDWTTTAGQTADGIASGARGERHVVAPSVQQIRREAEGG